MASEDKTLFWAMWPVLAVGRVFGLTPIPLRDKSEEKRNKILSHFLVHSVISMVAFTIFFTYVTADKFQVAIDSNSNQRRIITITWVLMDTIVFTIFFPCVAFRQKKIYGLLADFDDDGSAFGLFSKSSFVRLRRQCVTQVLLVILFALSYMVSQWFATDNISVLMKCMMFYRNMAMMFAEIVYALVLSSIKIRLSDLNAMIQELASKTGTRHTSSIHGLSAPSVGHTILEDREVFRDADTDEGTALSHSAHRKSLKDHEIVMQITWHYHSIFKASRKFDDFFGFPCLLFTIGTFLGAAFQSFFVIIYLLEIYANVKAGVYVLFPVPWKVAMVIVLAHLTNSSQSTINEGNKTRELVTAYMLSTRNHRVKQELQILNTHLANNRIRFSAHGFFELNYKLFTSITSALFTNLVILVQFHLASLYE